MRTNYAPPKTMGRTSRSTRPRRAWTSPNFSALRSLGLQPRLQPVLERRVGAGRTPARTPPWRPRTPTQRRPAQLHGSSQDVREARRDLGLDDGTTAFLYMPTHREYQPGFVPRLDLEEARRAAGAGGHAARARALLPQPVRPARRAAVRGPDPRRVRPPRGRAPLSRCRLSDHGLLVGDVRLRQPGPPDRDLRRRRGHVLRRPWHVLRRGSPRPRRRRHH